MNNILDFDHINPFEDVEDYFTPASAERFSQSINVSYPEFSGSVEDYIIPELNLGNIAPREDDRIIESIEHIQSPLLKRLCSNMHHEELLYAPMNYLNQGRNFPATMYAGALDAIPFTTEPEQILTEDSNFDFCSEIYTTQVPATSDSAYDVQSLQESEEQLQSQQQQTNRRREAKQETKAKKNASQTPVSHQTSTTCLHKVVGAVKLDQGYKSVLRPLRKALQNMFEKQKDLFKGRHHWEEEKWFLRVRIFLEDRLKLRGFNDQELAAVILMLYPAFGPSSGTEAKKPLDKTTKVFKLLSKEGMELFKTMLTDNNNEELRENFFSQKLVKRLWPCVRQYLTRDVCFPRGSGPNKSILPTYNEITREMTARGLPMPDWWAKEFPAL